eukprot:3767359-Pyramimonas_sp.AAC.1
MWLGNKVSGGSSDFGTRQPRTWWGMASSANPLDKKTAVDRWTAMTLRMYDIGDVIFVVMYPTTGV